jgi:hypothetical protein
LRQTAIGALARFCTRYLGMSRAQVDRFLQGLVEFGPNYFHLTQIVRVSPRTYRILSPALLEDGIPLHQTPIPLAPENAGRMLRAVRQWRHEADAQARAFAALPTLHLDPASETLVLQDVERAIGQLAALKRALR